MMYVDSRDEQKWAAIPTTLTVWDLWTDPVGVAALLDVWGRSWAGPERGSEILCVLTHGMGSTPPHHHQQKWAAGRWMCTRRSAVAML